MFEGFKILNLSVGLSAMSITANGVTFNKTSILKLGKPLYVVPMINYNLRQMAIRTCNKNDEGAAQFLRNPEGKVLVVRWNNADLLQTIEAMMGWNLKEQGYKASGEHFPEENAMLFDLTKATPIK